MQNNNTTLNDYDDQLDYDTAYDLILEEKSYHSDNYTYYGQSLPSCVNCYYSDGKYCRLRNIEIDTNIKKKHKKVCWEYRDVFTMRTIEDLQDEDISYDDIEIPEF